MTDDGKAKVVDRGIPSPSPSPEKQHVSPLEDGASLRRCYTTAGTTDKPKQSIAGALGRTMRASAVGRSRDSRTWEFWCDSDARNSLIERADQEASGSAAEAIGLIRSNSSRALKFNTRKMNTSAALQAKGCEPMKIQKPSLKRSSTHSGAIVALNKSPLKRKTGKMGKRDYTAEDFEHLNSESDKENCDPKPSRRHRARRPPVAHCNVEILGENTRAMSQANSVGATMPLDRQARPTAPSTPIYVDVEVSSFMSGGSSATASTGEELDCVQSLLSLSQGNWA
jgi:hypothetical protein